MPEPKRTTTNPRLAEAQRRLEAEAASYAGGMRRPMPAKPLTRALDALMAHRGFDRLLGAGDMERAWAEALGPQQAAMTKLGMVRRGVMTVTVSHPALLSDLRQFRKPALLAALRKTSGGAGLCDIRFRTGTVGGVSPSAPGRPGKG